MSRFNKFLLARERPSFYERINSLNTSGFHESSGTMHCDFSTNLKWVVAIIKVFVEFN